MRRFLLDTGVAQAFINDRSGVRQAVDRERTNGARIGICTPVLGELWSGIEGSDTREANRKRLQRGLSHLLLWPYDEKAAIEFGRVYTLLKRLGRPMQQIDIQIAAIALSIGHCTVVTADSDLSLPVRNTPRTVFPNPTHQHAYI